MARDYKRQYELAKAKIKNISTQIPVEDADEFEMKLAAENTNKSAKVKEWIYAYLRGDLK